MNFKDANIVSYKLTNFETFIPSSWHANEADSIPYIHVNPLAIGRQCSNIAVLQQSCNIRLQQQQPKLNPMNSTSIKHSSNYIVISM